MQPGANPLRVLLVSPLPPPVGGIARWTQLVISELETRDDVLLRHVDTRLRGRRITNNSLILRVWHGARDALRTWRDVSRALVRGVDVAHLNTSGTLGLSRDIGTLLLCRAAGVPVVLHLRFGRVPDLMARPSPESYALRTAFALSSAIVALESNTAAAVRRRAPGRRVEVIPNFAPAPARTCTSQRDASVMFVGHVIAAKGIEELLQAWASLTAIHPDWTLRIAGPAEAEMKDRLADTTRLEYLGVLTGDEITAELQRSTIYVLPSHSEGFPNSLLEAMFAGCICIATSVGAIPDMLENGAGIIVDPHDVGSLTTALDTTMGAADRLQGLARLARARAENQYSPNPVMSRYESLWREIRRSEESA